MKFYEIHNPYYALIKAKNPQEALEIYIKDVAEGDSELIKEFEEVSRDYAMIKYSLLRAYEDELTSEFENLVKDVEQELKDTEGSEVLAVDSGLI